MSLDHSVSLIGLTAVAGNASGPALMLEEPLSFWGGYDAQVGSVIEALHPQRGISLTGSIMLMAKSKGSSSSSSVLAEAIRNGTGPAGIVMREPDLIVGLGCIVASELYDIDVPMVVVGDAEWSALARCAAVEGAAVRIEAQSASAVIRV